MAVERCREKAGLASLVLVLIVSLLAITPVEVAAAEDEAPIVRVIEVTGNQLVPTDKILAAITNTKVGEPLDQEKIYQDLYAIFNLGYFREDSLDAVWDPLDEGSGVKVTFRVKEYPVVKDVKIEGLTVLSPDKVLPYLRTKAGQLFNRRELQEDVSALPQKVYDNEGIAVRPTDLNFDMETGVLTLKLTETRVGQITITGNEKTKDYVIRRELLLKPGDVFDVNKLRESLRRIIMLGHFEEVSPVFPEKQEDPDVLDLGIAVKERKTGQASFGAGYSSSSGFMGFIEVGDTNFLGRGETVKLRLEAGSKETTYDIEFYEPYLDSNHTSLDVRLYNTRSTLYNESRQRYDQRRRGGSLTLGRPISDYTQLTAGIKIENVLNEGEGAPVGGRTHSLQLGLHTNTTDHPFVPTSGYRNSLLLQFAGGLLRGDAQFSKYEDQLAYYCKVGEGGQVLAVRVAAGVGTGNIPDQEKFLVGGADTVRGYEYGANQGTKMLVINGEYRFPISGRVGGVVFVDSGRAWKESETVKVSDLQTGVGVGIRLDTPLGLMRFDYGFPLGGDRKGRFYFSFGQAF
ncbi:MAG: outer membrane protein assembly factor [Limnochordales bacterium]|nr:outer membrane protein assembly factor [Limnochordales bacterium]